MNKTYKLQDALKDLEDIEDLKDEYPFVGIVANRLRKHLIKIDQRERWLAEQLCLHGHFSQNTEELLHDTEEYRELEIQQLVLGWLNEADESIQKKGGK